VDPRPNLSYGEGMLRSLRRRSPNTLLTSVTLIVVATLAPLFAAVVEEAPAPHRVLVERKIDRLEPRLQELARAGYRLLDASDGTASFLRSNEFRLHLERVPDSAPRVSYRVVSGPYSGRLVKELDQAGAEGFRVHPRGILRKATPNPLGNPAVPQDETAVLILEADGTGPPSDYELAAPGTAREFGKELARRSAEGFSLVGVRAFEGGWLLAVLARPIVEQPPEPPAADENQPYLAVDERERKKLFDRVGVAAKRGYRVVTTANRAFPSGGDAVLLVHATTAGRPYSYYFLGQPAPEELEDRLNEGAEAGYRFLDGLDPRVELIMQHAPLERVDVRYRTVRDPSAAEIENAVSRALAEGWAWAGLYGDLVVLERGESSAHSGRPDR